ncbi:pyridoxamine 5'-phosphate oxidase family protein [Saccharomonospora sp. NPDC006951]
MLPGLDEPATRLAGQRLDDEKEIWITTLRSDGQPQSSPVGFLWDGKEFLILSNPATPKIRNILANPKVSLHLDLARDREEGSVLTVEGEVVPDPAPVSDEEADRYVRRYREEMLAAGLGPDELFAEFSSVIRVRPSRVRFS